MTTDLEARTERSLAFRALLALYAVAAAAMIVLALRPELVLQGESAARIAAFRVAFVAAAVFNAAVALGGWRRARWVRKLAIGVHTCIAALPVAGLVGLACGRPWLGDDVTELAAKFAVHALCAWLWSSRWMRRQLER